MSFMLYDLMFLALFTLAVVIFLYKKRHNLKKQGILYLYRTKLGIRFINWTARTCPRFLRATQYLVVASGYVLLIAMIWFLIKFSWFYITSPFAAKALKIPVLIPLLPYLPEIFKIDFLPPFYFTYWIIIIAIIAIPHEFAHGIFARLSKVRIHSTGFGFLGPFLAAFVEPDEKQMAKKSKFSQLSVLAAGTFANIFMAVLFMFILWLFFVTAFAPAGVSFNTYSTKVINISNIESINGASPEKLEEQILNKTLIEVHTNNQTFFSSPAILQQSLMYGLDYILVYENTPAFRTNLSSPILDIGNNKITSPEQLSDELEKYSPGDEIIITSLDKNGNEVDYDITLSDRNGKAYLGIGMMPTSKKGILGKLYSAIEKVKNPFVYYESKIGDLGIFIFDLLWWIVLISISVALVNMIPVGIFDGGRFFYLTIWGLTGSEKAGKKAFVISTWLVLILIFALMFKWIFAVF